MVLGSATPSPQFRELRDHVIDLLSAFESFYVRNTAAQMGMRDVVEQIRNVLNATGIHVYRFDEAAESYVVLYSAGLGLDQVGHPFPTVHPFGDAQPATCEVVKRTSGLPVLTWSCFSLDGIPYCVAILFAPSTLENAAQERAILGLREIYHLLWSQFLVDERECLRTLYEVAQVRAGRRPAIWAGLELITAFFAIDGAAVVEWVGQEALGFHTFDKTYVYHKNRLHDQFTSNKSLAERCVVRGRAFTVHHFDEQASIAEAIEYSPDDLTVGRGTRVSIPFAVAPKRGETEKSAAFVPLGPPGSYTAALKIVDYQRTGVFGLKQLRQMRLFGAAFTNLVQNTHYAEQLAADAKHRLQTEDLLEKADGLFHYREVTSGAFHQVANHLNNLQSRLLVVDALTDHGAHFSSDQLKDEIYESQSIVRSSKDLIARIQKRGQTLKPIGSECLLVHSVVRPALRYIQASIAGQDIRLTHSLTSADYRVTLDVEYAKESLINILTNALWAVRKHGKAGRKEVFVALRPSKDRQTVSVLIKDTGIGIDPAVWDQLFTPFFTTRPAEGGTGLGLYFARRLFEHFGGTVTIPKSLPLKGTIVLVNLPLLGIQK